MLDPDATMVLADQRDHGELIDGRYRLAARVGAGGTADVWRAHDERRDRTVILKILRERDDHALRARFLAEAHRFDALTHPGIVRVVGIHDALDATFIAFEHAEGTTLEDVARTRGWLPPREVALIVLQLAGILDALHRHGFAHLDLKPANVLLGDDRKVRLIDLGIAERIGDSPGLIQGTPGYVAPEVHAGGPVTPASDVYGLALVARDLIGSPPDARRASAVVRRALDPDPRRRPANVRRFAVMLAATTLMESELAAVRRGVASLAALLVPAAQTAAVASCLTQVRRAAAPFVRLIPLRAGARPYALLAIVIAIAYGLGVGPIQAGAARGAPGAVATHPPLVKAAFPLPALAAYDATWERQAPYPSAAPGAMIEWTVALRNTGAAGWYRGVSGAQASLALADGTTAAVQTTEHVGPGQIGWFVARFAAPSSPGVHAVTLHPRIDGAGAMRELGIRAMVTVTPPR